MLPLSEDDQRLLVGLARRAIEKAVREGRRMEPEAPTGALGSNAGAFVTLRMRGVLRGCIGHVESRRPLSETICACAFAAARDDPRFEPVVEAELLALHIEISVLSPLVNILPDEIEIGRHGLLVSLGYQHGLLLPQVATEWNWNREQFLEATCRKAGLARDAWQRGARVQAFTTQIFGEPQQADFAAAQGHAAKR